MSSAATVAAKSMCHFARRPLFLDERSRSSILGSLTGATHQVEVLSTATLCVWRVCYLVENLPLLPNVDDSGLDGGRKCFLLASDTLEFGVHSYSVPCRPDRVRTRKHSGMQMCGRETCRLYATTWMTWSHQPSRKPPPIRSQ